MRKINVAIIGAGLIGKKRAEAMSKIPGYNLQQIYDLNKPAMNEFALIYNCKSVNNVEDILNNKQIDLVILAIVHKYASKLAPKILQYKHLLIEKPAGRNLKEAQIIINSAIANNKHLFVGFNYHYYPHIELTKKYLDMGTIGKIISSTFRIGHAAFPGYEKTWKMNKDLCGGGVILDPGIHMIDLMLTFLGKPGKFHLSQNSNGWKTKVEDEAFITFNFKNGSISNHHYSLNLSQNTLFIEFIGSNGIIRLTGRGGNYGNMVFCYTPRWFWKNEQKIVRKDFGNIDNSFYMELKDILHKIKNIKTNKKYKTYLEPMSIIQKIY